MALPELMIGTPIDSRGAVATAPLGSTLPTDASTDLDPAFETVGLIGPEGFEIEPVRNTVELDVWGGTVEREVSTSFKETIRTTLMESANAEVLKLVYGEENVEVGVGGAISIRKNASQPAPRVWVFTMKDGDGRRRVVATKGQLKLNGAVTFVHSDAIKYAVEINCMTDANGDTSNEYISDSSTGD